MINPYSMTFHGEPLIGQIPCKVVARGAQPSNGQRQQLQNAYALFCANHRLSVFKNARVNGALPDGSTYTISVINGAPQIVANIVNTSPEVKYVSGFSFRFVDFNYQKIPGFTILNEYSELVLPAQYIVTPNVLKKTRTSDRTYKIRKVVGEDLGCHLWYQSEQNYYVAGFPDHIDVGYFNVNEALYTSGINMASANSYKRQREAGVVGEDGSEYVSGSFSYLNGRGNYFTRKDVDKKMWVMQVSLRYMQQTNTYYLDLYGEKTYPLPRYNGTLPLIYTMDFPAGFKPKHHSEHISPDGKSLRMIGKRDGDEIFSKVDIQINDDSLVISSISRGSGFHTPTEHSQSGDGDAYERMHYEQDAYWGGGLGRLVMGWYIGSYLSTLVSARYKQIIHYGWDRLGQPCEVYEERGGFSVENNYLHTMQEALNEETNTMEQVARITSYTSVHNTPPTIYTVNGRTFSSPPYNYFGSYASQWYKGSSEVIVEGSSQDGGSLDVEFADLTFGFLVMTHSTSQASYPTMNTVDPISLTSTFSRKIYHSYSAVLEIDSPDRWDKTYLYASDPRSAIAVFSVEHRRWAVDGLILKDAQHYVVDHIGVRPLAAIMEVPSIPHIIYAVGSL